MTSSSSRRRTGRPRRSTLRTARCSGASHRRATDRSPGRRRSRTRPRSPRPTGTRDLRGRAGRRHPQAAGRERQGALGDVDHARSDPREAHLVAQRVARAGDRHDGRLHRRRAALPGARRDAVGENGRDRHVWNSLCSDRHALITAQHLLGERLGDLVAKRRRRRSRDRRSRRRHRQRALERQHRLGRQRARALADASKLLRHWTPANQAAPQRLRPRSRLDAPGPALGRLLRSRAGRTASCGCSGSTGCRA